MSSPATSPGPHPSAIYDLNAFSPQDKLVEDRTVGLTAYPSASQYHRTKRHHSEYSSSLPPHHPRDSSRQLQHHHHHYHPQEHYRVNSESGRDRYRIMSSPETQLRHPIGGAYSGTSSSHAYSKVVPTKRWNSASGGGERGTKQIQRRRSENYAERQASVGAQVGERRGNFSRRTIAAQPKSDSSLRYNNTPELGLVYPMEGVAEASPRQLQIEREMMPHQMSQSGSEMREFLFEKMDHSTDHRVVHNLSGGSYSPLGYESGYHYQRNADEQRYNKYYVKFNCKLLFNFEIE